jgi:uncharacterized membrane protein YccC
VDQLVARAAGPGGGGGGAGGGAPLTEFVYPSFRARALGYATEMLGTLALEASGVDPPVLGDEPAARPSLTRRKAFASLARAHLTIRSVWLRNSLRGAAGLALAVTIAKVTDISHGFWVVLGALSVLRSSALGTGATIVRALAGTVAGFVVGTAIMVGLGSHIIALWFVLPAAVLVAGAAPAVISFAAGQAGFTVFVVIVFNILVPTGWSVGLVRIEDVAIGCGVSLAVGLLLWPRGAAAAFGRALSDAYATASEYLVAAVDRVVAPLADQPTRLQCDRAAAAYHRMDDAYRQFLAERGAKAFSLPAATGLVTGAVRLRMAAHSLATLPLRPAGASLPGMAADPAGTVAMAEVAGAVDAAALGVRDACLRVHAWYLDFAGVLAGAGRPVPPVADDRDRLRGQLTGAFESASAAHDVAGVRRALRLLWADEDLDEEYVLQRSLASLAPLT